MTISKNLNNMKIENNGFFNLLNKKNFAKGDEFINKDIDVDIIKFTNNGKKNFGDNTITFEDLCEVAFYRGFLTEERILDKENLTTTEVIIKMNSFDSIEKKEGKKLFDTINRKNLIEEKSKKINDLTKKLVINKITIDRMEKSGMRTIEKDNKKINVLYPDKKEDYKASDLVNSFLTIIKEVEIQKITDGVESEIDLLGKYKKHKSHHIDGITREDEKHTIEKQVNEIHKTMNELMEYSSQLGNISHTYGFDFRNAKESMEEFLINERKTRGSYEEMEKEYPKFYGIVKISDTTNDLLFKLNQQIKELEYDISTYKMEETLYERNGRTRYNVEGKSIHREQNEKEYNEKIHLRGQEKYYSDVMEFKKARDLRKKEISANDRRIFNKENNQKVNVLERINKIEKEHFNQNHQLKEHYSYNPVLSFR